MDGSILDHSDSDSGESWTILDNNPAYADDAPEFSESPVQVDRENADTYCEKDEDTDGISIISDSEHESSLRCDLSLEKYLTEENLHRSDEQNNSQFISVNALPSHSHDNYKPVSEDDFLSVNDVKHKTYVHRRNKRLSTVLNIIMLGSVITAAGVAIGHMWGAKNDCSTQSTPSVNKILSNLYKLQEENAYLRSKLKELSAMGSMQMQQFKAESEKNSIKQQKCRKVFEESLNSRDPDKLLKCIDKDTKNSDYLKSHMIQPEFEKEFLNEIDRLKNNYLQNKSWWEDVTKKNKQGKQVEKNIPNELKSVDPINIEETNIEFTKETPKNMDIQNSKDNQNSVNTVKIQENLDENKINKVTFEKKISYADSLKSKEQSNNILSAEKSDTRRKTTEVNRKLKGERDILEIKTISEEELRKDDRYIRHKFKTGRKKNDRQKGHKKQKRKNKYEQWEMKGGYMKDYDEVSMTSQENADMKKPKNQHFSQDMNEGNVKSTNKFSSVGTTKSTETLEKEDRYAKLEKPPSKIGKESIHQDLNWFEKRAFHRNEARKQLEQELFGEISPNNSRWYFKRIQKREQCRAKGDNSTFKKWLKRNMNYKMKH